MGIALSTLASLSRLLQAGARWLRDTSAFDSAAGFPRAKQHHVQQQPPGSCHSKPEPVAEMADRTPPVPRHRTLRGNWPFTAGTPQQQPAAAPARGSDRVAGNTTQPETTPPNRSVQTAVRGGVLAGVGSSQRSSGIKVFRRASVAEAGRLVIAGRMADVCAELDRMAASESALRTC